MVFRYTHENKPLPGYDLGCLGLPRSVGLKGRSLSEKQVEAALFYYFKF